MVTYVELMVLAVYAAMAGYIMYLQHQLKKSNLAGAMLTMLLKDMVEGDVEIERTSDGIRVKHKRQDA
jgi:hypothetical protein